MQPIWIDIGGTFTDAILPPIDRQGAMVKVLSSGRVPVSVRSFDSCRVEVSGLPPGAKQRDFWRGVSLRGAGFGATVLASDGDALTLDQPFDRSVSNSAWLDPQVPSPVLAARILLDVGFSSALPPLDVRLGTTRGTNALLTRTGAETTLLATQGFGDVLRIGEQDRPDLYTFDVQRSPPLTDRVIEVGERIDAAGEVLAPLDESRLRAELETVHANFGAGHSLAIAFVHAHVNDIHERRAESIARSMGFHHVSRSSEVSPLLGLVARTETTTLDAYLNPILRDYLREMVDGFGSPGSNIPPSLIPPSVTPGSRIRLMTSGGNLVPVEKFRGRDSILSGPAGGVVALGAVATASSMTAAVGLDMGGTSTDVSHFDGRVARRNESRVAGIRVMTPMMDIETVAAGGGSLCHYRNRRLQVGPDSAGADPGPACYGGGGPLCVTDLNVLLGRLGTERFPFPLDLEAARRRLDEVYGSLDPADRPKTRHHLADSWLQIAVAHMAGAVRTVTTARGNDVRKMGLVGFGGAAGGHVCRIADELGMTSIIDHPASGLMSALGMGLSRPGYVNTAGVYQTWDETRPQLIEPIVAELRRNTVERFLADHPSEHSSTRVDVEIAVRYVGTEATLSIPYLPAATIGARFGDAHQRTFGYEQPGRTLEIVSVQVEVTAGQPDAQPSSDGIRDDGEPMGFQPMFAGGRWCQTPRYDRNALASEQTVVGPAMIVSDFSTLVIEPGWNAIMMDGGRIEVRKARLADEPSDDEHAPEAIPVDIAGPVEPADGVSQISGDVAGDVAIADVEIYARRLQGIADSMGEVLRRTSMSVNVKQRRDYSCAVFSADGSLLAGALHVPVHLGAMSQTVHQMRRRFPEWKPGDAVVTNDPFAGGSHLPDVTVVQPVFVSHDDSAPQFFVASRAHHAEIGGMTPGSMPPHATCLDEEGVLIRPMKLVDAGRDRFDEMANVLSSATYPTRRLDENIADLRAQVAAGIRGIDDLRRLAASRSGEQLHRLANRWLDVAGDAVQQWIEGLPDGESTATDSLDDGEATRMIATVAKRNGRLRIEMRSAPVHPHGFNAPASITMAAVLYVVRCYCGSDLPLCDGVLRDVDVEIKPGMLCPSITGDDPTQWPAVVAGNVETSNRVVDTLIQAIGNWPQSDSPSVRGVAASGGTMNNTLFGDETFGYYETMGGGCGATDRAAGESAIQTHMTNTRMTDVEVFESRLPIRLHRFAVRADSGGTGKHAGGNGMIREFEFLRSVTVSLLTNRRTMAPPGAAGGGDGACGVNLRIDSDGKVHQLPPCITYQAEPGERLVVETPGGGGWGREGRS